MQLSAEEFLVSSGLQPLPRSAFLDPLQSFPDWECHSSAPPVFPAAAPPSEVLPFLLKSGFLGYGEYGRLMSSLPVPAGKTRLPLGPSGYSDDITSLRPMTLPLLLQFVELPHAYPRGPAPGSALAPLLYMDLLHLLLLSVEVQLALPAPPVFDEDEDDKYQ